MNSTVIKFSGTSVAMVVGMLLNLFLPQDRGIDPNKMPQVADNKRSNKGKISKDIDITNNF